MFFVEYVLYILVVLCYVFGGVRVVHPFSSVLCFWWSPCCYSILVVLFYVFGGVRVVHPFMSVFGFWWGACL